MKFKYYITTDCHGYKVLWREGGDHSQHAHLRDMRKVHTLLTLIDLNLLPRDTYLQGSCQRLLTPEEYTRLTKSKDRYYNTTGKRGVKR